MRDHEYPGVYVEEIGPGPRPIEGVPTSTAAFVGPTEYGPTIPQLIGGWDEFQKLFGGPLDGGRFLPHAVHGFFENGGRRAYVARVIGSEGGPPGVDDYVGAPSKARPEPQGLTALADEAYREVTLLHAPNATVGVARAVVAHCEALRHRFAVIDVPAGVGDASSFDPRAEIADSSYAACYHPWIVAKDPVTGVATLMPPGGHVVGIYARVDMERGVHHAPANEVLGGATALEHAVDDKWQAALEARGVNVIRDFPGRGIRVWGSRTLSSDGEWKYVNVRRYITFLERSIDRGTQWAVFEPNGERLWANVRDTVRLFLRAQWQSGALLGRTEDEAFFVKCDRTTMTQHDLDNGRLVCIVGVAPLRPAEFVIIRIGQWTAVSKC